MIQVKHVVKRYGATIAVNDVSFEVRKGEILGFLGPNGAGKSTTLKIITAYIVADSGSVLIDGVDALADPQEVRRRVGYLPESTPLYSDMQVLEYLRFVARARQLSPARVREALDRVVDMVGIWRMLKKPIGHLSKGYRQRVGIAQALIHDPPIIIMDEPTSGLDPHQIIEIRELIRRLGDEKLVILSSHILQEISAIGTRILIIKDGRIVADGSPDAMRRGVADKAVISTRIDGPDQDVHDALRGLQGVEHVEAANHVGEFRIIAAKDADVGPQIFRLAVDRGWTLSCLAPVDHSLEEVYLTLTEDRRLQPSTGRSGAPVAGAGEAAKAAS